MISLVLTVEDDEFGQWLNRRGPAEALGYLKSVWRLSEDRVRPDTCIHDLMESHFKVSQVLQTERDKHERELRVLRDEMQEEQRRSLKDDCADRKKIVKLQSQLDAKEKSCAKEIQNDVNKELEPLRREMLELQGRRIRLSPSATWC